MDIKSYNQYASDLESISAYLEETLTAMSLLYDDLADEGYQNEENFDAVNAVIFARRFPSYLSLFNVIQRDFEKNVNDLKMVVTNLNRATDQTTPQGVG